MCRLSGSGHSLNGSLQSWLWKFIVGLFHIVFFTSKDNNEVLDFHDDFALTEGIDPLNQIQFSGCVEGMFF